MIVEPYSFTRRSCTTAPLMRISARSIASINGATSSTAFFRGRPFNVRLGGTDTAELDRYLRTVLRSSPVSLATSVRLTAPDSTRARNRRSSSQRCGSKTTASPPSVTLHRTSRRVPGTTIHRTIKRPFSLVRDRGRSWLWRDFRSRRSSR
ncbi:hypothetical protein SBD_6906 [Streptomyces bottropensis ATCC 25435]|uniref:Uncharacterized protein n=1 Tax=Streptomyces bottropensis ATCC 25435 TaxID=1054862 RepID=M3FJX7_9ACTN|nr:hypothetical protein SBD_6906 [Streptomyces bottropensis ATCC 25435]